MSKRWLSWMLAGIFTTGALAIVPLAAQASSKGRQRTAQVLTGLAGYELLRHHTTRGVILGAGAAYAWKRHRDARRAEKRRARYLSSNGVYGTSYRRHRGRRFYR